MSVAKEQLSQRRNASKRSGEHKSSKVAFADFRFVRIELLADEKEDFKALLAAGEFSDVTPDQFISEGYTVKFSAGDNGSTVICSISQPCADHPNAALVLTGRGRDTATALAVCVYKHTILATDGLWRECESRRGTAYDDIG